MLEIICIHTEVPEKRMLSMPGSYASQLYFEYFKVLGKYWSKYWAMTSTKLVFHCLKITIYPTESENEKLQSHQSVNIVFTTPQHGDQDKVLQSIYFPLLFYAFTKKTSFLWNHQVPDKALTFTAWYFHQVGGCIRETDLSCHCNCLCNIRG